MIDDKLLEKEIADLERLKDAMCQNRDNCEIGSKSYQAHSEDLKIVKDTIQKLKYQSLSQNAKSIMGYLIASHLDNNSGISIELNTYFHDIKITKELFDEVVTYVRGSEGVQSRMEVETTALGNECDHRFTFSISQCKTKENTQPDVFDESLNNVISKIKDFQTDVHCMEKDEGKFDWLFDRFFDIVYSEMNKENIKKEEEHLSDCLDDIELGSSL